MEISIAIFIGLWFVAAGVVAGIAVFRDFKDSGEKR